MMIKERTDLSVRGWGEGIGGAGVGDGYGAASDLFLELTEPP